MTTPEGIASHAKQMAFHQCVSQLDLKCPNKVTRQYVNFQYRDPYQTGWGHGCAAEPTRAQNGGWDCYSNVASADSVCMEQQWNACRLYSQQVYEETLRIEQERLAGTGFFTQTQIIAEPTLAELGVPEYVWAQMTDAQQENLIMQYQQGTTLEQRAAAQGMTVTQYNNWLLNQLPQPNITAPVPSATLKEDSVFVKYPILLDDENKPDPDRVEMLYTPANFDAQDLLQNTQNYSPYSLDENYDPLGDLKQPAFIDQLKDIFPSDQVKPTGTYKATASQNNSSSQNEILYTPFTQTDAQQVSANNSATSTGTVTQSMTEISCNDPRANYQGNGGKCYIATYEVGNKPSPIPMKEKYLTLSIHYMKVPFLYNAQGLRTFVAQNGGVMNVVNDALRESGLPASSLRYVDAQVDDANSVINISLQDYSPIPQLTILAIIAGIVIAIVIFGAVITSWNWASVENNRITSTKAAIQSQTAAIQGVLDSELDDPTKSRMIDSILANYGKAIETIPPSEEAGQLFGFKTDQLLLVAGIAIVAGAMNK